MNVLSKLDRFYSDFNGEKFIIGKSLLNKPLYCFKVQKTYFPKVIVQYAIHAREHITTLLALEQIREFTKFGRYGTVYFIPSTNPDGIEICLSGKPLYKANARGVDLNVNFDAKWGPGKSNVKKASDSDCIGEFPFSEPETRALRDFTLAVKPQATISYHCKGEEIYWEFFQKQKFAIKDKEIALSLAKVTGYTVKRTPDSAGGYKDWCIEKLKIPAFTIEVASDLLSHPIGEENLREVFARNKAVIPTLIDNLRRKYE